MLQATAFVRSSGVVYRGGLRAMSEFMFRSHEHAELYSKFRPAPPSELIECVVSHTSSRDALLDVGCGSGQSAELMAGHFKRVVGADVSEAQIAQAEARRDEKKLLNVEYRLSPADEMTFDADSFNVITASQCVHWFDLDKFYSEAHRVLRENGLLAMFGYCIPVPGIGEPEVDKAIHDRIMQHYRGDLGPYWEVDRTVIDSCYETLPKPKSGFELLHKNLAIVQRWPTDLNTYMKYMITWSSYQKFQKENPDVDILGQLKADLANICRSGTQKSSDGNFRLSINTNFFLHIYRKLNVH